MNRQGKHGHFAVLIVFACFMFPALLYKSLLSLSQRTKDREGGSSRTRRSVELEKNTSAPIVILDKACLMPTMDDFPGDFMTQYQRKHGGAIFHFLLAMYMFIGLATVCDDYFVPSLEKIALKLRLSSDVAGATFMAVGTSAPELFAAIIGVFITEGDIGLAAVVGSGMFNVLFVLAICALFAGSVLPLSRWPLLRDSFCYLMSIAALVFVTYDEKVYWYEALALVCMYLLYVAMMYFNRELERRFLRSVLSRKEDDDVEGNITNDENKTLLPHQDNEDGIVSPFSSSGVQEIEVILPANELPSSTPRGIISWTLWIIKSPVTCLFYLTIPDCRKDRWENWYYVSFVACLVWTAILSYVLVWMLAIIGFTLAIPGVIMGLTFLAAGSSVPEGISSLIVARRGDGDMAVSHAIGSNVFNILFCLGVPWLLKTTFVHLGGHVDVVSGSMSYTSLCLFASVIFPLVFIALNRWYLNKFLGMIFLVLYLAFVAVATLFGLNLLGDFNEKTCKS